MTTAWIGYAGLELIRFGSAVLTYLLLTWLLKWNRTDALLGAIISQLCFIGAHI